MTGSIPVHTAVQPYLERIAYQGSLAPRSSTLVALHRAQLQAVPFENLDIHRGTPITLDEAALYEKIVVRRRGGFCYELNGLFAWLLRQLGFDVTLLSARVAGSDGAFGQEFDHLALRVTCPADESAVPWLVDVGFGDGFRSPLRLDQINTVQPQGDRAYRLTSEEDGLLLWQRLPQQPWQKQYRFTPEARRLRDFEAMCHYQQTSPESHFTQGRVCTLATPNGRITLSDQRLIVTENGQRSEHVLDDNAAAAILAERFGIILT